MGTKFFGLSRQRSVNYAIALFDKDEGRIVAFVDGNGITAMRTAATSAVAVDLMVAKQKVSLGVIGSGHEAREHVRAIASIRGISQLAVYSPTLANRTGFAELFTRELGVPCRAVDNPRDAITGAELIVGAATSKPDAPNIRGEWFEKGQTVVSISSTLPEQWELDPAAIAAADLIVCDSVEEVTHATGDFIAARRDSVAFENKVHSLSDLVKGKLAEKIAGASLPMFKSAGSGMQDIAVAALAYRKAIERGDAVPLDMNLTLKGGSAARRQANQSQALQMTKFR